MLILNRNNHETLRIGDDITLSIVVINDGQVRFGIDAPKDVGVAREELRK